MPEPVQAHAGVTGLVGEVAEPAPSDSWPLRGALRRSPTCSGQGRAGRFCRLRDGGRVGGQAEDLAEGEVEPAGISGAEQVVVAVLADDVHSVGITGGEDRAAHATARPAAGSRTGCAPVRLEQRRRHRRRSAGDIIAALVKRIGSDGLYPSTTSMVSDIIHTSTVGAVLR